MTTKQKMEIIGRRARLTVRQGGKTDGPTMTVLVTVEDVRDVFGGADYLVTPIAGDGSAWIREGLEILPAGGDQ